jgi:hypothetical protein
VLVAAAMALALSMIASAARTVHELEREVASELAERAEVLR